MRKKIAFVIIIFYTLIGCSMVDMLVTPVDNEPTMQQEQKRDRKRRK